MASESQRPDVPVAEGHGGKFARKRFVVLPGFERERRGGVPFPQNAGNLLSSAKPSQI